MQIGMSFVAAALHCTDKWRESNPDADYTSHRRFCEWIVEVYYENTNRVSEPVANLLDIVSGGQDCALYSPPQLLHKLKKNAYGRAYRIVAAVLPRAFEAQPDTLVRSYFQKILAEGKLRSVGWLTCSFFTDCGRSNTGGRVPGVFQTALSTRFQQLLFLSMVVYINTPSTRNERKRRREVRDAEDEDSGLAVPYKIRQSKAQRVGAAIQIVVRAWDAYAKHLGLSSVEELCFPYMILQKDSAQFRAIGLREEGFAPIEMKHTLAVDLEPTTDEALTFPGVCTRPAVVDAAFRTLTTQFLQDIHDVLSSNDLYTSTDNTLLPFLSRFQSTRTSPLSPRFHAFLPQHTNSVRTFFSSTGGSSVQDSDRDEGSFPNLDNSRDSVSLQAQLPSTSQVLGNTTSSADALWTAMKPHVALYRCSFADLVETHHVVGGEESLDCSVQLVLSDPPYNCRRERGDENAAHDVLFDNDMEQVVDVIARVLRKGGHALVFCSIQQFNTWSDFFRSHGEREGNRWSPTFTVSPSPDYFVYHSSAHKAFPGRQSCTRSNAVELAVHVKKNGLSFEAEKSMVNYRSHNFVQSSLSPFRNVIDSIRGLEPGEKLLHRPTQDSTYKMMRPEQKCLALLKELIARHTNPDDIVVDLFGGTFSAAIACLTLPDKRKFIGCELDEECFLAAKQHVLSYFAQAVVARREQFGAGAHIIHAAEVLTSRHAQGRRHHLLAHSAESAFPLYQHFPTRLCGFLSSLLEDPGFLLKTTRVPYDSWPQKYQSVFTLLNSETLLHGEAAQYDLMIGPSTIKHPASGRGVFATRTFHVSEVLCPFYGTLVYCDMERNAHKNKTFGEGLLSVDNKQFRTRSIQVNTDGKAFQKVKEHLNGRKAVSIVPPSFAVAGFINEASYFEGDKDYNKHQRGELQFPRKPNVSFVQTNVARSPKQLLSPDIVVVQATTIINPGQELFSVYHMEKLNF